MTFDPRNQLLAQLEPAVAIRNSSRLERVQLRRGEVVQEAGGPIEWVWFPDNALICIASENIEGESVSGGMVGWNGTYGAFEACGSRVSFTQGLVQIGGDAWKIRASHYRELFDQSSNLRTAIHKHIEALLVEARQLVACTALHRVENRMCRALLDAAHRSHGGRRLTLTQEELANMLGVQRSTIAVAASALQRSGLIRTGRGYIELVDVDAVEATACPCRRTIAYAQEEIYSSPAAACEG